MGESRKAERTRGKSDPIDALASPGRRFGRVPRRCRQLTSTSGRWN